MPYHNINHLLTVLKYCDYIAEGEGVYYDQRLPLWLAALFHDVNHSGGELSDDINIKNARNAFMKFADQEDLDIELIKEVGAIINATEFPYASALPHSNISKLQTIIRDADLMQQFESNWIYQATLGLAKENNIPVEEFIPRQRIFLEDIKFLTETARKFKSDNWSNIMAEFRILEITLKLT